jgi:arginyl-tRNA synthetase
LFGFGKDFTKNISQDEYFGQTVICEFSDPNPFKVLHVGHLYTSMVGDSISRLVEFAGGKVIRANFGGDVGLHVAKTMYVLQNRTDEINDSMSNAEKVELIAKCYVEGTRLYEDDEEAHDEITRLNGEIYKIAAAGKAESDSGFADLYWWGREASYDYFKDFYAKIGVKFDRFYPESTVAPRGLAEVLGHVGDVYEKSDGAVVFKGEKYGLHTRVFVNKNGLPTYEAKDVGLIYTKWDDYKFDKSIVITGNDIIEYMKVVLKSVSLMNPELPERTVHLTHGNVRLPGNAKMSSRKGNFIKAEDVINDVAEELAEERGEASADFKISMGAIKYAFLKYKIGGNIIFSAKESVSMTGNSGPYLQYSAVRAAKILGKLMKNGVKDRNEKWVLTDSEKTLINKIIEYPEVLKSAVHELAPHQICNYLYTLAQEFSRFYETTKVAGSECEFERGQIVLAYLKVLTHGLSLLGIEVPEEM